MDMMWGMPVMMLVGAVFWLAFLVVLGFGIWWAVRQMRPNRRDEAIEILRERYARGQISREEFEARRRDLAA
jgi:putative membrane protein